MPDDSEHELTDAALTLLGGLALRMDWVPCEFFGDSVGLDDQLVQPGLAERRLTNTRGRVELRITDAGRRQVADSDVQALVPPSADMHAPEGAPEPSANETVVQETEDYLCRARTSLLAVLDRHGPSVTGYRAGVREKVERAIGEIDDSLDNLVQRGRPGKPWS